MQRLAAAWMLGISLSASSALSAQDPPESERIICDVADPKNKCPGPNCLCTDDTFEITFDGGTDSVFEYESFVAGTPIPTQVICDAKSTRPNPEAPPDVLGAVQAWTFGVEHDDVFLTLTELSIAGTESESHEVLGGFVVYDMVNIQTCAYYDPDPKCPNPQPATGYLLAVIRHFIPPIVLEPGRNLLLKADYTLKADPGPGGTLIQFVDYLKKRNSPTVDINITVNGFSRLVTKVVNGWVKATGPTECLPTGPENLATAGSCTDGKDNDCDGKVDADEGCCVPIPEGLSTAGTCTDGQDNDCDGKIDVADEGCHDCKDYALYFGPAATDTTLAVGDGTSYVVSMRNRDPVKSFQLGVKATTAGGITTWDLSGDLGTDASRLVKLVITDDKNVPRTPEPGNKATSIADTVKGIVRGAAIAGFSGDDHLTFDLAPGAGGPGFTALYLAPVAIHALGRRIPATGAATPCPINEILRVTLAGEPRFRRGDANGDSKLNLTDAILIIHHLFGGIPTQFACDDILDTDDDGNLTLSDAFPLLSYMFRSGPGLPAPFKTCGTDPTTDALPCSQSSCP